MLKDGPDATPAGMYMSIYRSDLTEAAIARKEKPAGKGIPGLSFSAYNPPNSQ